MIKDPTQLHGQSVEALSRLAEDLRQRIISASLRNGGHLGASLGAVELAIALHAVFESPQEPIMWDVGHQAYAHKLLTGRWDRFDTLRTTGGISGFLSRSESEHDVFGAGHSSTSISAALAFAWARRNAEPKRWSIAVIGDGAMTAGVAFEALNNVEVVTESGIGPLLVVLNDNQMSISANSGAMASVLSSDRARDYFALFGFDYVGPVDGHDLSQLIGTLQGIRQHYSGRPVVLHALTQKGKGYGPAESRPSIFHGVSPIQEKAPGTSSQPQPNKKTYSAVFGSALCALAEKDDRIVAITAAMPEGTGLTEFARRFPDRFFDVGIAEPHAVLFAAGLATQGYKPVVAIYSTFLQRALDSVIHDVALQGLGVTLAIDRAGVVGADGPTHHGAFDLAYLGMIPGMSIVAPTCQEDLAKMLSAAVNSGKPQAIRFPRGSGLEKPGEFLSGSCDLRVAGSLESAQAILIALGSASARAESALHVVDPAANRTLFISVGRAKPLPSELLRILTEYPALPVLCVEDGCAHGGFGESLLASVGAREAVFEIAAYGDHFIPHGAVADLEEAEMLSVKGIARRLNALLAGTAEG